MHAQRAERLGTGRPLTHGDLLPEPGRGYVEVDKAYSAGDCAEARVEIEILKVRNERRGEDRG